jgi:hypothetical protein
MANKKPSVKKKPTIKEMASVVITINDKLHEMIGVVNQLDRVLGMYISMKGDNDELNKFITEEMDKAKERYDAEQNEKADSGDISGDTDGEGSGTEGVREEK